MALRLRRVKIRLEVFDRHGCILRRRACAPFGIAVAPVRERDMPRGRGDGIGHAAEELAVGVKGNVVGGPVEAVFVEAVRRGERERDHLEGAGVGGVEAVARGVGRL